MPGSVILFPMVTARSMKRIDGKSACTRASHDGVSKPHLKEMEPNDMMTAYCLRCFYTIIVIIAIIRNYDATYALSRESFLRRRPKVFSPSFCCRARISQKPKTNNCHNNNKDHHDACVDYSNSK